MIETVIILIIVAKLKRYKLKPVLSSWSVYPALILLLTYIPLQIMLFNGNYFILKYSNAYKTALLLSFLLPIINFQRFKAGLLGATGLFTGTLLNKTVIGANGGKMPVFPTLSLLTGYIKPNTFDVSSSYDKLHILGNSSTKLKFLSDIFDFGYSIMSIGDILTRLYAFIVLYSVIKHLNSKPTQTAVTTQ